MERFWSKVDVRQPDECWPWKAGHFTSGYGCFRLNGRIRPAHVIAYELTHGEVPSGHDVDHTCHNESDCPGGLCVHRGCCNPAHLEAVTHKKNVLRGKGLAAREAQQTECLRGHDLTDPANLKPNKRGSRQCRACIRFLNSQPEARARRRARSAG